ncbi:hypothetical protein [Duganella aceris]|uniref:KTSC domain-containing protein n=1 Tax=Duganella aceris TaxID=2703883 RepID=A0ABX0FKQ5_9BURK|nr:hypothetical protein [Duganella aceris]NGZ85102.1 hypothetical protein [Duganella aceris]
MLVVDGNHVQVIYGSTSQNSHFDRTTNTIHMIDRDVQATANVTGVSYDQAYAEILVHEVGRWVYDFRDTIAFSYVQTATEFKQWFFPREGESSIFGAGITAEVRDNGELSA